MKDIQQQIDKLIDKTYPDNMYNARCRKGLRHDLQALLLSVQDEQKERSRKNYNAEYEKKPYGILSRKEANDAILNAPYAYRLKEVDHV